MERGVEKHEANRSIITQGCIDLTACEEIQATDSETAVLLTIPTTTSTGFERITQDIQSKAGSYTHFLVIRLSALVQSVSEEDGTGEIEHDQVVFDDQGMQDFQSVPSISAPTAQGSTFTQEMYTMRIPIQVCDRTLKTALSNETLIPDSSADNDLFVGDRSGLTFRQRRAMSVEDD